MLARIVLLSDCIGPVCSVPSHELRVYDPPPQSSKKSTIGINDLITTLERVNHAGPETPVQLRSIAYRRPRGVHIFFFVYLYSTAWAQNHQTLARDLTWRDTTKSDNGWLHCLHATHVTCNHYQLQLPRHPNDSLAFAWPSIVHSSNEGSEHTYDLPLRPRPIQKLACCGELSQIFNAEDSFMRNDQNVIKLSLPDPLLSYPPLFMYTSNQIGWRKPA
jgi:hypothetical protein